MSAPKIPIAAYKRVPLDINIPIMGIDYTGAALACEIRGAPGDQGSPIVGLAAATPPSQGISVSYDPDYLDPEGDMPNGASIIRLIVSESTLEALSYAADPSKPVVLSYDIHITPVGGLKSIFSEGNFIINPGVTL